MKNNSKSYSVKFYAEMKLDDGRVVATEDDQFMIGSKIFAVTDDGNADALASGEYTMENGNKLKVSADSKIEDLGEDAEEVETEEPATEELAEDDGKEADVDDWAGMEKRIQNLEDAIADLKDDKVEASKEEKTEMSIESAGELLTQIEDLNAKVVALSNESGAEAIKLAPEGISRQSIDLSKLSVKERAAYYINNK